MRNANAPRRRRWATPFPICLTTGLLAAATAMAQTYTVDWSTIDGGGGSASGGAYVLSGTIGQPDAAPTMTGGAFALTGGFWGVFAVQVTDGPTLNIEYVTPTQIRIWWAPDDPGWILQESANLPSSMCWSNSPSGATNPVGVPASPLRFYRVFRP